MWNGMENFKKWLDNLPSTNFKIFVSAVLSVITALVLFTAMFTGAQLDENVLAMWLTYLAAFAGINYLQFAKKRETYRPSPPNNPDVEDTRVSERAEQSGGAAVRPPAPVAPSKEVPPRRGASGDEFLPA